MPSETPEDGGTPFQPKSKQERIRDNQRRSRARRQEYLADLERRLSECQITCREADIQRAAFLELQIENARLKELLSLAGVNDQFVEHYVSQALSQSGQYPPQTNPALRQLKPKINSVDSGRQLSSSVQPRICSGPTCKTGSIIAPASTTASTVGLLEASGAPPSTSSYVNTSSYGIASMPESVPALSFNWLFQPPSSTLPPQESTEELCCESLGITTKGPLCVADENTVLCSVAKSMIEQYHLTASEMERVKTKLSRGCANLLTLAEGVPLTTRRFFKF